MGSLSWVEEGDGITAITPKDPYRAENPFFQLAPLQPFPPVEGVQGQQISSARDATKNKYPWSAWSRPWATFPTLTCPSLAVLLLCSEQWGRPPQRQWMSYNANICRTVSLGNGRKAINNRKIRKAVGGEVFYTILAFLPYPLPPHRITGPNPAFLTLAVIPLNLTGTWGLKIPVVLLSASLHYSACFVQSNFKWHKHKASCLRRLSYSLDDIWLVEQGSRYSSFTRCLLHLLLPPCTGEVLIKNDFLKQKQRIS